MTTEGTGASESVVHLLDANVLIALIVTDHVHHEQAERWSIERAVPFATCPITQGSLVRFLVREGASGEDAVAVLRGVLAARRHRFWSDDVGFDGVDLKPVFGHRQVTDAYLAGLARAHGGRLATLDRGLAAIHPDVVELIPS